MSLTLHAKETTCWHAPVLKFCVCWRLNSTNKYAAVTRSTTPAASLPPVVLPTGGSGTTRRSRRPHISTWSPGHLPSPGVARIFARVFTDSLALGPAVWPRKLPVPEFFFVLRTSPRSFGFGGVARSVDGHRVRSRTTAAGSRTIRRSRGRHRLFSPRGHASVLPDLSCGSRCC